MHDGGDAAAPKREAVNYKTVLVSALVSFLMCVIVGCVVCAVMFNRDKKDDGPVEYEAGDVLPSGAIASGETGGTADVTLEDGTVITYTIPDKHYKLHDDYLNLVQQAYGLATPVTSNNLVVTGNENNVYSSTSAITATTFSDIYNIYKQIYGESWTDVAPEDIYPPIYQYIQSGEVPETPYTNYAINELDSIEKDGVTYRVFEQDYDAVGTASSENVEVQTNHVHQVAAYSNTSDVVEIIVDVESGRTNDAVKLLKTFIGA